MTNLTKISLDVPFSKTLRNGDCFIPWPLCGSFGFSDKIAKIQDFSAGGKITSTECFFQALYLLLQCGHNVEEAIRRRKMQAVPPTGPSVYRCCCSLLLVSMKITVFTRVALRQKTHPNFALIFWCQATLKLL